MVIKKIVSRNQSEKIAKFAEFAEFSLTLARKTFSGFSQA